MRAQHEGVDVAHHFRDWHGSHNTDSLGLGHGASHDTGQVSAFKGLGVVHRHVVSGLVASSVLELHILQISCSLLHKLLVAKAGGEHQLVALACHVAHHALGVSAFRHALDHRGFDLVTELFLNRLASQFVLESPATITNGADIDKANLELVNSRCLSCRSSSWCGFSSGGWSFFFFATGCQSSHGHGGQTDELDQRALARIVHECIPS